MFRSIVWATDGSELADRALPLVEDLARTNRSKIVALHASELSTGRFGGAPLVCEDTELLEKLERQVAELRRHGFTAELRVVRGLEGTAALLAHGAREVEANLIVLGTHGHGTVAAAVLGSVARGLLHTAPCPVLAVPPAPSALRRAA